MIASASRHLAALLAAATALAGGCTPAEVVDVSADLEVIATKADGLDRPQDLAFDPDRPGELWVVSRNDDSATRIRQAGEPDQTSEHMVDPYALHFMDRVSSIAFGATDRFATCQDSRNTYNGSGPPNRFMGPALWSSDPEVFGTSNPAAVAYLSNLYGMPTDLGSHLDMLHESPECLGIAWEAFNAYWVYDGDDGALVRYDFQHDHGVGYDDHSDGVIARYVSGELARVKNAVAHVAFDDDANLLYAADPGNGRVVVLDTKSGTRGKDLSSQEPGVDHHAMKDARLTTLIDGHGGELVQPAGIELVGDAVVITDTATGHILITDANGRLLTVLDTGLSANRLAGVWATDLHDLWVVDAGADRVLRIRW
ncbi:MAG: hypothetical protein H6733_17430 [Alphaproteobacteria bacterium]|nr:hypothetical protein [Alphaproteobacteria bacterium]